MAEPGLSKGVDLVGVVGLGLGMAVGVSIFSVISPAAALAGPGMLIAVAIAAVPMFVIAVSYAFMGSALPTSGASYEWPRRFIHPFAGFFITWLRIAGNVSAVLVLALVLVRYVSTLIPLPVKPAMFACFALVYVANLLGVGVAARVQTMLVGALLLVFTGFVAWGAPHVPVEHYTPLLPEGWAGVVAAVPLLITLFLGLEVATEVGEEVHNPRKLIPLGIALSLVSAVVLYLAVSAVAVGVLGTRALAESEAPLVAAAEVFMGRLATPLMVVAAVAAIGTSLNALFMTFSRSLYAMGRTNALPSALASIHPRFGTPYVALTVVFVACTIGLLAPMSLTTLFLAVNIPTLLKYAATNISASQVVRLHPDIYARARFRFSRRLMHAWAWAGAGVAVLIIFLGFRTDWRPYAALGVWAVLGIVYYLVRGRVPEAEGAIAGRTGSSR